jgi:hypothetical protein
MQVRASSAFLHVNAGNLFPAFAFDGDRTSEIFHSPECRYGGVAANWCSPPFQMGQVPLGLNGLSGKGSLRAQQNIFLFLSSFLPAWRDRTRAFTQNTEQAQAGLYRKSVPEKPTPPPRC